jgi:hypothetical protein
MMSADSLICEIIWASFGWLAASQPAVLFSYTNSAPITNQPAIFFSHNKSAPATGQPNESMILVVLSLLL